jgi:hypothetical protein
VKLSFTFSIFVVGDYSPDIDVGVQRRAQIFFTAINGKYKLIVCKILFFAVPFNIIFTFGLERVNGIRRVEWPLPFFDPTFREYLALFLRWTVIEKNIALVDSNRKIILFLLRWTVIENNIIFASVDSNRTLFYGNKWQIQTNSL